MSQSKCHIHVCHTPAIGLCDRMSIHLVDGTLRVKVEWSGSISPVGDIPGSTPICDQLEITIQRVKVIKSQVVFKNPARSTNLSHKLCLSLDLQSERTVSHFVQNNVKFNYHSNGLNLEPFTGDFCQVKEFYCLSTNRLKVVIVSYCEFIY